MNPTSGPWFAENVEEEVGGIKHKYIWKITGADGVVNTIARLGLVDAGPAVVAANARLISKAPDLYCALSALVGFHDGIPIDNDIRRSKKDLESLLEYSRKILEEAIDSLA